MDFSPTIKDIETVRAFALFEGNIVKTALALDITEKIALDRVIRISRKASLGYRQRRDLKALALKLQEWLKEALAMVDLIEKFRISKLFKNTS